MKINSPKVSICQTTKVLNHANFIQLSEDFNLPFTNFSKTQITTSIDKIPPKLVKQKTAAILSKLLCDVINNSLLTGIFPDDAKIASVHRIDKGSNNKCKSLNYRPVSVLNYFSNIHLTYNYTRLLEVNFPLFLLLTENAIRQ